MKTRFAIISALILSSFCVAGAAIASGTLQSCSRLSGAGKATCEWQNHQIIKQMGSQVSASASSVMSQIGLPSCSRMHGQDLATCEWKNHQQVQSMLRSSSSSPISVSTSSKSSVRSAASCNTLRGKQAVQCRLAMRKANHG